MTDDLIHLRTDFDVELVSYSGNDAMICKAARVSTMGAESLESDESAGLLRFLLRNRHGSPFEHGLFTYRITAPIFVWREFMRHRVGFSYNEESGRYKVLEPVFYIPSYSRPLEQIGKPGKYEFVPGTDFQKECVGDNLQSAYRAAWFAYTGMLEHRVAKEVARLALPVATYSSAYVTCNPRSLMNFLSLRTKHEDSKFPSYPQWEINKVADQMEAFFQALYPLTHEAFNAEGRVSP